jgi:hypothetical protein
MVKTNMLFEIAMMLLHIMTKKHTTEQMAPCMHDAPEN